MKVLQEGVPLCSVYVTSDGNHGYGSPILHDRLHVRAGSIRILLLPAEVLYLVP